MPLLGVAGGETTLMNGCLANLICADDGDFPVSFAVHYGGRPATETCWVDFASDYAASPFVVDQGGSATWFINAFESNGARVCEETRMVKESFRYVWDLVCYEGMTPFKICFGETEEIDLV